MPSAKVHDLKVRPLQSVDLCFEVDGILGEQNAQMPMLGLPVTPFNFAAFNANLGVERNGADPGRLKFDSQAIHDDANVQASLLFALRSESVKAVLDKMVATRENAFYQKYKNQADIIAKMRLTYELNAANPNSKPSRLNSLITVAQSQHDALSAAYNADGRTAVVKATTNDLTSNTTSTGVSDSTNSGTVDATSTNTGSQNSTNKSDSSGKSGSNTTTSHTDGSGGGTTNGSGTNKQNSTGTAKTSSTGTIALVQSTKNTDYVYRHPSLENEAQYQRAQISLLDEQFSQYMFGQNLPMLDRVFVNELRAIDLDVKRLQVAYLNTILMSPIDGSVTGVFKDLGDSVRAGEPVIRVENDVEVLLVGTLIYRGMLSTGSKVSITTLVFGSPDNISISGAVVSIRGHDSEEDEWDVLVRCKNRDAGGNPLLPINYNFDFDDTTVTIT
jgi:hypothetical protein